jgi:uncharacterized protein (TIGR00730 family)
VRGRRVAVYCASAMGTDPKYRALAEEVGTRFANEGIEIVYGGGRVGLMGVVADSALAAGGRVIGVIPERLATREIAHEGLSELHVVQGMHARKQVFVALAHAFVALPGGFGTLDEIVEAVTWAQLGHHAKPSFLLDPFGYYEGLVQFVTHASNEGFISARSTELLTCVPSIDALCAVLPRS